MSIVVEVLVLTYKRPRLLADTLRSLSQQQLPADHEMRIVVVDNDPAQTAAGIVREVSEQLRVPVHYVGEPVANIAAARNRALSETRGAFAAFIDDDEVADPKWLAMLLEAQRRFQVAVVFGPVLPRLPAAVAPWIERGGFFDRPRRSSGLTNAYSGTGNVLLDLAAVRSTAVRFDTTYGRSGGEDTEFFFQLRRAGCSVAWCDEALVWEQVSAERATVRWLLQRSFSGGNIYARIFDRRRRVGLQIAFAFRHALIWLASSILTPFALLAGGPARGLRVGQLSARSLGRLVGVLSPRAISRTSVGISE